MKNETNSSTSGESGNKNSSSVDDGVGSSSTFADTLPILRDEIRGFELSKRENVQTSTWVKNYERTIGQFVEFLTEHGVEELDDIDPDHFRRFNHWLLQQRGNNRVTRRKKLKQLQTLFRDFWMHHGVPRRWVVKGGVIDEAKPILQPGEASRADESVPTEVAERIVDSTRSVAKELKDPVDLRDAAILSLLFDTGARCSGIVALDCEDFEDGDSPRVHYVNRPETGTRLKSGDKDTRWCHLTKETAEIIQLYLESRPKDIVDEHGRIPLFHSGGSHGNQLKRVSKKVIKDLSYGYTRPCEYDRECPEGKDPNTCEFAKSSNAMDCPCSHRPHAWRGTAINVMYYQRGRPRDRISDRVGVSVKTLNKHYLGEPREADLDEEYDSYYD